MFSTGVRHGKHCIQHFKCNFSKIVTIALFIQEKSPSIEFFQLNFSLNTVANIANTGWKHLSLELCKFIIIVIKGNNLK